MSPSPREVAGTLSWPGSLSAKFEDQRRGFTAEKVDVSAKHGCPMPQPALPGCLALLGAQEDTAGHGFPAYQGGLGCGLLGNRPQAVPWRCPPPILHAMRMGHSVLGDGGVAEAGVLGRLQDILANHPGLCFWPQCEDGVVLAVSWAVISGFAICHVGSLSCCRPGCCQHSSPETVGSKAR